MLEEHFNIYAIYFRVWSYYWELIFHKLYNFHSCSSSIFFCDLRLEKIRTSLYYYFSWRIIFLLIFKRNFIRVIQAKMIVARFFTISPKNVDIEMDRSNMELIQQILIYQRKKLINDLINSQWEITQRVRGYDIAPSVRTTWTSIGTAAPNACREAKERLSPCSKL